MLAVHTSNNSSRQASPGMPPSSWQHQNQNYREPRAFRSAEQDAAVSSALVQGKLAGTRPSPDVFQNGNHNRMPQLDAKQTAFSIDSDDLLTPQRESLSSGASTSSSPQESVPDLSSSSTSSSPPHQSQYRHPDYPQRQSVASPTFSTDSHRSSLRASPSAQHQQLPDEFGRAAYPFDQPTVRPGDRQGLSPLSPFTEPFSPPGSERRSPQPGMLYAASRPGELTERRSVSSLSSANSQATTSNIDTYSSPYADYRPPSTSSSVATPAASNQQAKSYTAMTLNGDGATANPLGFPNTTPASTLAHLPLGHAGSDHFGPSSRSSQDSSTAASTTHPPSTAGAPEEISTIFVVGFPDDMHEREFQNMFIFSPGFEAAILKTPHANSAASNTSNSSRDGALAGASKLPVAGGLNYGVNSEQYGVSMMHGHGIFDNQMDDAAGGPTLSHALSQRDGPRDLSQRKQIIGFAKFRSRQEAMDARDVLSGRRVDAEKDCVLKAEMAKKNLHTRRGLANEAPAGATSSVGVGNTAGNSSLPSSVLALGQQNLAIAASLNPSILANIAQRSPSVQTAAAAAHAAASGPSPSESAPGPVLREVEPLPVSRDRSLSAAPQQRSAFDAFHSVPASQVSPSYASRSNDLAGAPTESRFNFGPNGPRDAREAGSPPSSAPLRQAPTAQAPYSRFGDAGFGKSLLQQLDGSEDHFPAISQSNDSYGRQAFFNGRSEELSPRQLSSGHVSPPPASYGSSPPPSSGNYTSRFQGLSLNTGLSNTVRATSPPSAGMLSPRGGNPADMNPPINTLYVGGLPAVLPSLTGPMSASHLEDSLRAVFSRSPGFKRLCFRQKSNGPMSFVEFDNVEFATRAMQDLYGHTLGGLVKGGIRLSFSKNPLGVRSNSVSSNSLSTPLSPNFGDAFFGGPSAAASTPTPQTPRRLGVDSGYMSPHNASAYGRSMGSRAPTSPGFTPFTPPSYDSNAPF